MKETENTNKETISVSDKNDGIGKKLLAILAALMLFAGLCYVSEQSGTFPAGSASAQISEPNRMNPVSGNRFVKVSKPLYIISESGTGYSNLQYEKALDPSYGDYVPNDIPEIEALPVNEVTISGNKIKFTLPALAGISVGVFADLDKVSPSEVPDEQIEINHSFRDDLTLYGTITEYGQTQGMESQSLEKMPAYYLNGTIDRLQNNLRTGRGFTCGYKKTVYHHDGLYKLVKEKHDIMYTYPGLTEEGKVSVYDDEGNYIRTKDVEYQAFSRFQILYYPNDDQFQIDIILIDTGTTYLEGADGLGEEVAGTEETDFVHRIILMSDYKYLRDADEWYKYVGHNYITVDK